MTSKPETVSQEAWDAAKVIAKEATRDAMRDPLMPYYVTVAPHIARAIMAATAEAYADAAELAQRMGAGRKSQSEQAKTAKQPKVARDFESMAMSAFDIAAAIRKRGEA